MSILDSILCCSGAGMMGVRIETEAFIDVGNGERVERDDSHRGL